MGGRVTARLGDALRDVLARVERSGAVDDEAALEHERGKHEARQNIERDQRRERIRVSGVALALTGPVMDALVRGRLEPRGTSQRAAERWLAPGKPPVLVLQGGAGCGKTVAAAMALAQFGGLQRPAASVVRAFASRALDATAEQERMLATRLLVLDDLGTEHSRDREWMVLALRELLEARQGARTLITTNLAREQAIEAYRDPRIESRLKVVAWVRDTGPDLRGAG